MGARCGSRTGGSFALISALKHDDTITGMSGNHVDRNAGGTVQKGIQRFGGVWSHNLHFLSDQLRS